MGQLQTQALMLIMVKNMMTKRKKKRKPSKKQSHLKLRPNIKSLSTKTQTSLASMMKWMQNLTSLIKMKAKKNRKLLSLAIIKPIL